MVSRDMAATMQADHRTGAEPRTVPRHKVPSNANREPQRHARDAIPTPNLPRSLPTGPGRKDAYSRFISQLMVPLPHTECRKPSTSSRIVGTCWATGDESPRDFVGVIVTAN
jgi:hypothetical protein